VPARDLSSLTFDQIQDALVRMGEQPFRGRQIFSWLHKKNAVSWAEMTDLSKELRARLENEAPLTPPEIAQEQQADDGTIKFRYRLQDGQEVEGVFMPEQSRSTLCVSTQVGCGMGCKFCATATMGLRRNLTAGEISGQLEAAKRKLGVPISNVVFMGMGEPLANLQAVLCAVDILLHPHGHYMSRRHVTVSTAGLVPAMEEFVHRTPAKLAVSLNATTNKVRNEIMPVNRKYPIESLLECCRHLPLQHTDRITFEYVMLGGLNDTEADARRLIRLLGGIRCKVNLIPFNPFGSLPYARPDEETVEIFQETVAAAGITVMTRKSRGQSLQGACGQLVVSGSESV
jgi:23S rRNA (adenine2503-C2)-methyltransferase